VALEKGLAEALGQFPKGVDRADEVAEAGLVSSFDELDVGGRADLEPPSIGGRCSGIEPRLPSMTARPDQSTSSR